MTNLERYEQLVLSRSMQWKYELSQFDDEVVRRISALVSQLREQIAQSLDEQATDIAEMTFTDARRQELALWLDEVVAGTQAEVSTLVNNSSLIAGEQSLAMYNNIMSVDGMASGVQTVGFTTAQFATWFDTDLLDNVDSTGYVNRVFDTGVKQKLYDTIATAGIEGKGVKSTVNRLMQASLEEGIQLTEREAITISRTYMQTANVGAQKAVYQANADLIREYERIGILDNKICAICAPLDGQIYKSMEDAPSLPSHFNCRCLWLAKIQSWRKMGLNIDDLAQAERNWLIREDGAIDAGGNRKVLQHGTTTANFREWWYTLTDKQKASSIGKVRTDLINQGKLSWSDLSDMQTGRVRTLKEMGFSLTGEKL